MVQLFQKTSPTSSMVHIDRPLTNMSLAFMQAPDVYVADLVFPSISVQKQSDKYFTFPIESFYSAFAKKRAPGTEAASFDYSVSTDTYFCDVWAGRKEIPWETRVNEDAPLDSLRNATQFVTSAHLIRRELQFASTALNTSTSWDSIVQGVSGAPGTDEVRQWSDYTNGTPVKDVRSACTTVQGLTGIRPNTLTLTRDVYDTLLDHPDLIDRINRGQTTGTALVTRQDMARLFDVQYLHVMDGVYNVAKAGQTADINFIASGKALLTYTNPMPSIEMPAAGYTYDWTGYLQGSKIKIERYDLRPTKKVDVVEGEMAFQHKIVSSALGYLFYDLIA